MHLKDSEIQFLDLVRYALNDISIPESLTRPINWSEIYQIAKKQAMLGITFDALVKLSSTTKPSSELIIQWYTQANIIEKMSKIVNANIQDIVGKVRAGGLDVVLLKGQGLAQYYPNPLHRHPGDIDLYFFDKYNEANDTAAQWDNVTFNPDTSYHRSFTYKNIEIENHLVYVDFYCSRNRKAWQEIEKRIPLTGSETLQLGEFSVHVPQPQLNVIYVFLHSMHHLLQVGIGLRQICDWCCLWQKKHQQIDKELFQWSVDKLKIRRSMTAMAYVVENYLGLEKGIIPLDTTTAKAKKDGEMIIQDILSSGNFGHSTDIMKGFVRNAHINNLKSYYLAFKRQLKLFRLYPSEVIAYPAEWIKSKFKGS